jgi:hypothetical protein
VISAKPARVQALSTALCFLGFGQKESPAAAGLLQASYFVAATSLTDVPSAQGAGKH